MLISAYLAGSAALLPAALALDPIDLGYWDVNITSLSSVSGYEAQLTWAVYSGKPNKTIYDEWNIKPPSGNITTSRNDRSFHISVDGICGLGPSVVNIKQRVDIGDRDYWLAGTTNVSFTVNPVTGHGGSASFRVNATLDDTAKDVCGRPLNPEVN